DPSPVPQEPPIAVIGTPGNDRIVSTAANEAIDGRTGDDTVVFSQSLDKYTVTDLGQKIVVSGPDGSDTLTSIEHLQFADGVITPEDGNLLFDTAFYLSHNLDVFHAGVDALTHYNVFGFHEGRDPNAWFDTDGYLAHYPDVAAAGVNPLEHYAIFGF